MTRDLAGAAGTEVALNEIVRGVVLGAEMTMRGGLDPRSADDCAGMSGHS